MGSEPGAEPSLFGRSLAARSRPQIAIATQVSSHRLIGRIARSSAGFGLAVGRSTSVRPVVRRSELNSVTLRPPTGFWMQRRAEMAAPEAPAFRVANELTSPADTLTSSSPQPPIARRSFGPRPHAARRTAPTVAATTSVSWTDQLLGGHRPAPPAPEPEPVVEPEPAPPPRPLDPIAELQAMFESGTLPHQVQHQKSEPTAEPVRRSATPDAPDARERSAQRRSRDTEHRIRSADPAEAVPAAALTTEVAPDPTEPENVGDQRRGDTKAGARTGPGLLSRSMAPERAEHVPTPPSARRRRRPTPEQGQRSSNTSSRSDSGTPDPEPGSAPQREVAPRTPGPGPLPAPRRPDSTRERAQSTSADQPTHADPTRSRERVQRQRDARPALRGPDGSSKRSASSATSLPSAPTAPSRSTSADGVESTFPPSSDAHGTLDRITPPGGPTAMSARATNLRPIAPSLPSRALPSRGQPPLPFPTESEGVVAQTEQARPNERETNSGGPSVDVMDRPGPAVIATDPTPTLLRRVTLPRAMSRVHRPPRLSAPPVPTTTIIDESNASSRVARSVQPPTSARSVSAPSEPTGAVRTDRVAGESDLGESPALRRTATPSDPAVQPPPNTVSPGLVSPGSASLDPRSHDTPSLSDEVPARPPVPRASLVSSDEIIRRAPVQDRRPSESHERHRPSLSVMRSPWSPAQAAAASAVTRGPGALLDVVRRAAAAPPHADAATPTPNAGQPASSAPIAPVLRTTAEPIPTPIPPSPVIGDAAGGSPAAVAAPGTSTDAPKIGPTDEPSAPQATTRAAASEQLVERFMGALSERVQRQPAPLPTVFQPMADVIAPGRRVMLSTDEGSRRALRSVGKVAATVDNVIHLDTPSPSTLASRPDRAIDEIVAHELTHAAHQSSKPRFFDDIDQSLEERKADAVAHIMANSALAPSAAIAPPPPRAQRRAASPTVSAGADTTIRRTVDQPTAARSEQSAGAASMASVIARAMARPAPETPLIQRRQAGATMNDRPGTNSAPSSSGAIDAASLAARYGGGGGDVIRRSTDTSAQVSTNASEQVQRWANAEPNKAATRGPGIQLGASRDTGHDEAWFTEQLERNMDLITRRLEERMIVDFERRGGRIWGGL